MTKFFMAMMLGVFSCCLLSGCAETKTTDSEAAEHDHDDHEGHDHGDHEGHDHGDHEGHDHGDHEGHDHGDHEGHDHDAEAHDAHGPFGGHVFAFDSKEYRGEWKHYNDNDVIRVYVLDSTGKKAAPVKATVAMVPLGGSDKTPFDLEAEKPDAEGCSAVYSLDDKNLGIATTAVGVTVEMKIDDKTYRGVIEAHAPHDH